MNSRVKTQFGLVVLGFLAFPFFSNMTRADELGWGVLKTEKIEIELTSSGQGEVLTSYPGFLQKLLTSVLSWDPRKELNNSPEPVPEEHKVDLTELLRNLSVDFDVSDPSRFRKVWFHLTPTLKVRGLFGVHDFKTRRPLIILRMGIHGNVDELLAERFIAKAVFEDLDANFLILESLTSHAFITQNMQISFGGIEEGLHTFLIMNQLNQKKYGFNKIVSSYHLVGVSLGGQGTFVTTLMDQSNEHLVKSVLNMCPLINLKNTFDFHAKPSWLEAGVDFWNLIRLRGVFTNYSENLKHLNLWKMLVDQKPRFTPRLLKILDFERDRPILTANEIQRQIPQVIWPRGFYDQITKSNSLYELNDFWKTYQGVTTPIKIYTTPKDFLVVNDLNSDLILDKKQPGDFRSAQVEKLNRGMHCGLASVFSWPEVVKMIKVGLQL